MEAVRSKSKQASKRKSRQPKDKTKPKGACSAYIMFTTEQLAKIQEDPTYVNADGTHKTDGSTGEAYKHTAFMSIASQRWGELGDEERAVYEKMADADKIRYEKEMKEWKANGEEYYTKADGTKSNAG